MYLFDIHYPVSVISSDELSILPINQQMALCNYITCMVLHACNNTPVLTSMLLGDFLQLYWLVKLSP